MEREIARERKKKRERERDKVASKAFISHIKSAVCIIYRMFSYMD